MSDTSTNTVPGRYSGWRAASMVVPKIADHLISIAFNHAANGSASNRVNTNSNATNKYGSHAVNGEI